LVSDLRQNVSPFDQPKYRKLGEKIRDITISKEKKIVKEGCLLLMDPTRTAQLSPYILETELWVKTNNKWEDKGFSGIKLME
jgi:hypothetical protein